MKSGYLYQLLNRGRRNALIFIGVVALGVLGLAGYFLFLARQDSVFSVIDTVFFPIIVLFLILSLGGGGVALLAYAWRQFKRHAPERHPLFQRLSDLGDASHIAQKIEEELSRTDTIRRYGNLVLMPSFLIYEYALGPDVLRYEDILSVEKQTFPFIVIGLPGAMVGLYNALQRERREWVWMATLIGAVLLCGAGLYWTRTWIHINVNLTDGKHSMLICRKKQAAAFLRDLRARMGSSASLMP